VKSDTYKAIYNAMDMLELQENQLAPTLEQALGYLVACSYVDSNTPSTRVASYPDAMLHGKEHRGWRSLRRI